MIAAEAPWWATLAGLGMGCVIGLGAFAVGTWSVRYLRRPYGDTIDALTAERDVHHKRASDQAKRASEAESLSQINYSRAITAETLSRHSARVAVEAERALQAVETAHFQRDHQPGDSRDDCPVCVILMERNGERE